MVDYNESDNESSSSNEDSKGSQETLSAHEVISPKKEEEVEDVETEHEKEILVPTKHGKKLKSSKYIIGFCVDLAWCKKIKWVEFLNVVKFQKWPKVLSSDDGLFEDEMSEFCSKLGNNDGLCIRIVHGEFVKCTENRISEWFD